MQIKYKNIECKTIMIQCPLSVLQDHVFGFETYLSCHDPNDNTPPRHTHLCSGWGFNYLLWRCRAEQNQQERDTEKRKDEETE